MKYTITPTEIFHIYMYNEKRNVGVIVYFTVMFDHPLVSLPFAVLVSLHPDTFLMFFLLLVYVIASLEICTVEVICVGLVGSGL